MKNKITQIGVMLVMAVTCMLLGACTQSNRVVVNVVGSRSGSVGVSGIPAGTNYGGHPCVKGRGVAVAELQKQLASEYSVVQSDRWAGQTFYQEVGASSGRGHTITFVMAAGLQVFVDNGSRTPCYLFGCCNRIWPAPAMVAQSESGGASVVINQTNTQAPSILNSAAEGLGGGLGVALGVGMTEFAQNARQWDGGGYYQPSQNYYQPQRQHEYRQQHYSQRQSRQQYHQPQQQQPRQAYCSPASPSQSVGRGGASMVFQGAHNTTRDPNGAR